MILSTTKSIGSIIFFAAGALLGKASSMLPVYGRLDSLVDSCNPLGKGRKVRIIHAFDRDRGMDTKDTTYRDTVAEKLKEAEQRIKNGGGGYNDDIDLENLKTQFDIFWQADVDDSEFKSMIESIDNIAKGGELDVNML